MNPFNPIQGGGISGGGSFTVTDYSFISGVSNFPAATKKTWLFIPYGPSPTYTPISGWLGGIEGVGLFVNSGDLL
jgi:hypothetical protein